MSPMSAHSSSLIEVRPFRRCTQCWWRKARRCGLGRGLVPSSRLMIHRCSMHFSLATTHLATWTMTPVSCCSFPLLIFRQPSFTRCGQTLMLRQQPCREGGRGPGCVLAVCSRIRPWIRGAPPVRSERPLPRLRYGGARVPCADDFLTSLALHEEPRAWYTTDIPQMDASVGMSYG